MRSLSRDEFAVEAGVSPEVVDRMIEVDAIRPLPDGRLDVRDEATASTAQSLLDAGIPLGALAQTLGNRQFGLRSLGHIFSEPGPRTAETYADLSAALGPAAAHLPGVYAALGIPEPRPTDHPRAAEARAVCEFIALWSLVDATGEAHIRVARQIGEGTRRIAESWLDVWDEIAQPGPTTQGAPTVGPKANPADPTDPEQNPSIGMAELSRRLVSIVHERQVEATLNARILASLEGLLVRAGELPARADRPPAIAFIDVAGFTSLTVERGDLVAADVADRLRAIGDGAAHRHGGRLVKALGDGILLRFDDAAGALQTTFAVIDEMATVGLPAAHVGIAAGHVVTRDGDVFGTTVNLASRIAALAAAGEVLVEEGVVIALPAGTASFTPVGRRELKGLPTPVALWQATKPRR